MTSEEFVSSEEDEDVNTEKPPKKSRKVADRERKEKPAKTSDDPQLTFELDSKRKVTLSQFKGKWRVDIREFYDDKGEMKPGRKGISLSLEQWEKLISMVPDITQSIQTVTS